jgi:hypothetical protein
MKRGIESDWVGVHWVGVLFTIAGTLFAPPPLSAAQYQFDFDDLPLGAAPPVFEPVAGHRVRIEGTGGSVPTLVVPATGTRSAPNALRNEPAPGSEFGSADQDLWIHLEGFRSHSVRLYAGMLERNPGQPVTATLTAYRSVAGHRVLVTAVSRTLGDSPVGPNLPRELIVESAAGEIEMVRLSYGSFSPAELIDSLLVRVWDGDPPPPPSDTVPPVVHLEAPDPAGTPPSGSVVFVAGYVDEERALTSIRVTTPAADQLVTPLGDPPRYFFGAPIAILDTAGPQTITVTATDLGGHSATDSVVLEYTPAPPPPPFYPETLDFTALGLEVTQAIQDWETLGVSVPGSAHPTHLIAGKKTLVRFYARVAGTLLPIDNVSAQLRGYHGAVELPGSPIRVTDRVQLRPGDDQVSQRTSATRSFNFVLPPEWTTPGGLRLLAEVNPYNGVPEGDGLYNPLNNEARDVRFDTPTYPVHIRVSRVRSLSQGNVLPSRDECLTNLRTLRQLYPVPPDLLEVRFVDTVDTSVALIMESNTARLEEFLDEFLDHLGFNSGRSMAWPAETVFLALTHNAVVHRGITDGAVPVSISVANDAAFYRNKTAHESGHALGLGHVRGCDSPASPYEDYPRYFAPDESAYPQASIGDWAVEFADDNTFSLKDPAVFGDVMSYCDAGWVSKFSWERLYDILGGHAPAARALAGIRHPEALPIHLPAPYLHFGGRLGGNGTAFLHPGWGQAHPDGSSDHPGLGDYQLELVNTTGKILFTRSFKPTPILDSLGGARFLEIIPAVPGAAQVVLRKGTTRLATLKAGPAVPKITVTNPDPGESWPATGTREIAWTASDADNDPLEFQVEYSHDSGATWRVVRAGLRRHDAALQLDDLPGGAKSCLIRIIATDGLHTAQATSGIFGKALQPPAARILAPHNAAVFRRGEWIRLEGAADDAEDGVLPDAGLRWVSERLGPLGNGRVLATDRLGTGFHRLRLEATDTDGHLGTDEVALFVTAPRDTDGDGLDDAIENKGCTDPEKADSDGDRIADGREDANHNANVDAGETSPCDADTDDDGLPDGWEVAHKLNPRDTKDAGLDSDRDGFANLAEFQAGTDPWDAGSVPNAGPILRFQFEKSRLQLVWEGTAVLESADTLRGPWREVSGAGSPHRPEATGSSRFFRLRR